MKTYFLKSTFFLLLLLFSNGIVNAQVYSNGTVANNVTAENPFFDASSNFDNSLDPTSSGKGLVFPTTDLTTFIFKTNALFAAAFPSALDGMIVYNVATGNTLAAVSGNNGVVTAVAPGYYYFSNPGQTMDVTFGIWTPLGSNASKNITATAIATAIAIDGVPVYAIKGQFTTVANSALTTIVPPTGITGVYRITIFKGTSTLVFSPTVNSFDFSKSVDNVITGDAIFSQVYPVGTYNYILEYFK
jgi:hypothetical protein